MAVTACLLLTASTGCRRAAYRMRADAQTYQILDEKIDDPRWYVPRINVEPHPASRFFDGANPDHPPLPPDDPAANRYMQCAYGMHGAHRWRKLPKSNDLENPFWMEYLPGQVSISEYCKQPRIEKLGLHESMEIALVNSRDFQSEVEDMYVSALALTFQRYRFDVRPIGFSGEPSSVLFFQNQPNDASNLGLGPTRLGFSKLLPAGGQFVTELTNNTLWLFSGPNGTGTATSLAYSLAQPLLAGAGREIAMERLTQAERGALYSVRDFARFRKDFYVSIVTGRRATPLPGNTLGSDLSFFISAQRSPSEGYYSLLIALQRLRNQERNVRSLESLIGDLDLVRQAGRASALDVTQLESSLARARPAEAFSRQLLENRLDRFKMQLGLPPDMEIEIDDELLEQFQFVAPELTSIERGLTAIVLRADKEELRTSLQALELLAGKIEPTMASLNDDLMTFEQVLPDRNLPAAESAEVQTEMAEVRQQLLKGHASLTELENTLAEMTAVFDADVDMNEDELTRRLDVIRIVRRQLLTLVRELTGLTIAVRVELVALPRIPFTVEDAVDAGLRCRLDLMNRRGFVMDARRRLETFADRLEATVDVVAEGSLNTPPLLQNDNPLDFRAKESNFRVGLEVTTPLDRRRQRNEFRAAQISYQRARRNFMAAEDQVKLDIRRLYRAALTQRTVFESNRAALRIAARELDQAIEQGERPGVRAGGQGISISRALDNVLVSQNQLIESWVAYESSRMELYRDIGVMEIDERGHWIESDDLTACLDPLSECWRQIEPLGEELDFEIVPEVFDTEELDAEELNTEEELIPPGEHDDSLPAPNNTSELESAALLPQQETAIWPANWNPPSDDL